jgi:MFS transporter, OFA family, oxalate/formate antiporter
VWGPAVGFPVLCLPAVACYLLLGTGSGASEFQLAAFLLGFAGGAESDLIAFLAARYFGMAHFGRIYGMLYMPFGLFSAISPLVYGIVRDRAGSYDPLLSAAMALFVVGGALLLLLGRYPDQAKAE